MDCLSLQPGRRFAVLVFATLIWLAAPGTASAQTPAAAAPKFKGIWEPINYSEDLQLTGVFFVTPEVGYVTGASGTILKTTDSGATWTAQLGGDPASEEAALEHPFFVSPTVGWANQRGSSIRHLYRTTDGENWSRIGTIQDHYEEYAFSSETEGVYINDEVIYRTRDARQDLEQGGLLRNQGADRRTHAPGAVLPAQGALRLSVGRLCAGAGQRVASTPRSS